MGKKVDEYTSQIYELIPFIPNQLLDEVGNEEILKEIWDRLMENMCDLISERHESQERKIL